MAREDKEFFRNLLEPQPQPTSIPKNIAYMIRGGKIIPSVVNFSSNTKYNQGHFRNIEYFFNFFLCDLI